MTKSSNVSQLTNLAIEAKNIALESEMELALAPIKTMAPTKEIAVTQATDNPSDVLLATNTIESAPVQEVAYVYDEKSDTYFPINVNLPGSSTNPTTQAGAPAPLTEEEKRQRTIIVASVVLLALIVLVAIVSMRKKSK